MSDLRQRYPHLQPYAHVVVQADGYEYVGEVMSFPVPTAPEPTVMVRRVPGHPGTLEELPVSKVRRDPVAQKLAKWVHYAKVLPLAVRSGHFPVDMLRYEGAAPVNFVIDTEGRAALTDKSLSEDFVVACVSNVRDSARVWSKGRWESFCWQIIPLNTLPVAEGGPARPARGMRFLHSRLLPPNNVCEVTKVAFGMVYYKLDGERKARSYIPQEDFHKYVKEVL